MRKFSMFFVILTLVLFFTACGAGNDSNDQDASGSNVPTQEVLGVECIETDGLLTPAGLGESQLTDEELKTLYDTGDPDKICDAISTVPDAIRYFRVNGYWTKGDLESDAPEDAMLKMDAQPLAVCKAADQILAGDYDETGYLECKSTDDFWGLCYVKQAGLFYAVNVADAANQEASTWMGFAESGNYVADDLETLKENIKSDYPIGGTMESVTATAYPPPTIDKPVYSSEEIKKLVKANLSLDDAAGKISTVSDAINYLTAREYTVGKFSYNPGMQYKGIEWSWGLSADFTYDHNAGTCAGTSNLFNRLLKDDFDDQGYVKTGTNEGGHVFNWFMKDGIYYFCDFADTAFTEDPYAYLQYKTKNTLEFGEYYLTKDPEYNDKKAEFYLMNLYMFSRNGENMLPGGFDPNGDQIKPNGEIFTDKYPDTIENLQILFIRDGYTMEPAKAPTESEMPQETHIPDDNGNYYD